jgi:hypothetical protein
VRLRTDHVAGGAFVLFGIIVYALSGDLPFGSLASPGAGMMPKLAAGLMTFFGLILVLRASDSEPLATVRWADLGHALPIVILTAIAITFYARLGFIVTMASLIFALLTGLEHRNPIRAALFSVGVTLATYLLFTVVLKAPLEPGILKF